MDYLPEPLPLDSLSQALGQHLLLRKWHVATAESCTGGGLAAAMTQVAGSSAWFECGIISYGNRIKQKLLNVSADVLAEDGAVSEAVVMQMVKGVLGLSDADIAVAVSGIAGPSGGTKDNPIGTVWFAWAHTNGEVRTQVFHFVGDRVQIQHQAIAQGLRGLLTFFD
ncbi:MAG: CinA family protein [Pseudomonadota bacterium]